MGGIVWEGLCGLSVVSEKRLKRCVEEHCGHKRHIRVCMCHIRAASNGSQSRFRVDLGGQGLGALKSDWTWLE